MPGAKKSKGAGKSKKAKAAEEAARLAALQEARLAALKDLRVEYATQAKLLLRDPLSNVLKEIERAITEQTDVAGISFSKTAHILASDLWGINNSFMSYRALRSVSFTSVAFDDKMLSTLCQLVAEHCGLESLTIIDGKLNHSSARILSCSLPHSNIRQVVLDYNPIASGWPVLLGALLSQKTHSPANAKPAQVSLAACTICLAQATSQQVLSPLPPPVSLGTTSSPSPSVSPAPDIVPRGQRPHSSLERFSARFAEVGPEAADGLAELLRTVPTIRAIDLSGNHLGPKGFATVCQGVRASTSIESIVLAANAIRIPNPLRPGLQVPLPAAAAPNAATALLPSLPGAGSVTATSTPSAGDPKSVPSQLSDSPIPPAVVSSAPVPPIPRKLVVNPALERDPIARDTQWVIQGATHLSAHLTGTESRLSLVDLRHNLIGDEAAQILLDGLRARKTWLTSGTASGSGGSPPPVCVYLSERSPTEVFAKHIELNRWMEALMKKRAAAAAKKGKKKKK
ncbi:hypothetical protein BCR44DRAFT_405454 [Catenaria anguillulae PL171]|uniref:Uncharacterized protein n=1 Tax=Catenaria anguillulae PL171 TaxID=765915 RepID=A0A1Y2HYM6_9FUNG|nr:hypothetical protein BCR44DRAFT_405454 [Catenaria anguillulae PL171]